MKASNGGKMDFVAGDLIEFGWIYSTCSLNNKTALYLGECFIYRPDGKVIENHKVLVIGEHSSTIIDKGLLRHMKKKNKVFS